MNKISTKSGRRSGPFFIEKASQIELLASAVRQEILDSLEAMGRASIRDLARAVGVPADALYYHVRKLLKAGLLIEGGVRQTDRREEVVYQLPRRRMRLRYDLRNSKIMAAITRTVAAMLRVATRDFTAGTSSDAAVTEGPARNLRAARFKAWLNNEQLAELNQLLRRVDDIFQEGRAAEDHQLCALTWVLSPVDAKPIRREST